MEDEERVNDAKSETSENVSTKVPVYLPLSETWIEVQCKDEQIEENDKCFL